MSEMPMAALATSAGVFLIAGTRTVSLNMPFRLIRKARSSHTPMTRRKVIV
jgi:hypothetical protein